MCIFTGGGCIFLNYGVHGYGKTTFPLFTVGFWLPCQDKGKRGRAGMGQGVCGCLLEAAPGDVLACFRRTHAFVPNGKWFNHVSVGIYLSFLVSCFSSPLGRVSSAVSVEFWAPLFFFSLAGLAIVDAMHAVGAQTETI
jgi:hypothetical protein